MISKPALLTFMKKGFRYVQSNVKGVTLLYRVNDDGVNVCALVDDAPAESLKGEDFEEIAFQVERKLLLSGYRNVDTMFFIFSNHPEKIKKFTSYNLKFWILDLLAKKVIVYENQPEDYFSLRHELEEMMLEPEVKEKAFNKVPFVTLSIALINILMYGIMAVTNSEIIINYGASYWGYVFNDFEFYRLFTNVFLHYNITHLINNIIIFILAGNQLEATIGRVKFLIVYLISGVGASVFSAIYYMLGNQHVLSAGASGAIYGVIGAIAGIILRRKKGLGSMMGVQFFILIAFIIFDGASRSNIDFMAHLSGFGIGLILTFFLYKSPLNIYKVS